MTSSFGPLRQGVAHPAVVTTARSATIAAPGPLRWLVALAVGSSFFVAREPAPTDLIFVVLMFMLVAARGIRFPLDLNPLLLLGMIAFIIANTMSLLLVSADVVASAWYYAITIYLIVSWYTIVTLLANFGDRMLDLITRAFLLAACLAAVVGLIGHFTPVLQDLLGVPTSFASRSRSTFKDPNVYAPFLSAALILVINGIVVRRWLPRLLAYGLLGLLGVEILASLSRGGYVNLVVALAVYTAMVVVLMRKSWIIRLAWLLVFGFVAAVPLATFYLATTGLEDLLFRRLELQAYDTDRFVNQSLALLTFGESPLGIGPGRSESELMFGTHNLYLQVLVETGLVAALGIGLFGIVTLRTCFLGSLRAGPYQDLYICSLAILVGILVNSLVIDSLHWRHFFLFLALPIGLAEYERWSARAARAQRPVGGRVTSGRAG